VKSVAILPDQLQSGERFGTLKPPNELLIFEKNGT
jgi:hypothetical protein